MFNLDNASRSLVHGLLSVHPDSFRALRAAYGFDFEKPFQIAHNDGKISMSGMEKLVDDCGQKIAIIRDKDNRYCSRDKFHLIQLCGGGTFEIEVPKIIYHYTLDHYYRKADVHEARKSAGFECYVIGQKSEYIQPKTEKPFDLSGRFSVSADRWEIKLSDYFTGRQYKSVRTSAAKVEELIDKSGYLLQGRREELRRRAANLRRERAKTAYIAQENGGKVEELRRLIEEKRRQIVKALESAKTSDDLKKIGDCIDDYKSGLCWIAYSCEMFAKKTEKKAYASIEESNTEYTSIIDRLGRLSAMLGEG